MRMRSSQLAPLVVISLFFIVFSGPVWALSAIKRDFNELLSMSDLVIVGTVLNMSSHWRDPEAQNNIDTTITFDDLRVLKGKLTTPQYEVLIAGGSLPPYSVRIPGAPNFTKNKRYVLFIKDNRKTISLLLACMTVCLL